MPHLPPRDVIWQQDEQPKELPENHRMATGATSSAIKMIESGNLSKAESWLKEASKKDPTYAESRYHLARLYETKGEIDKAVGAFDEAIELGFSELPMVVADKRLEKIRELSDFGDKLNQIRKNYIAAASTRCGQPLAARPSGEKPAGGWPLLLILPPDQSRYKDYIHEADSWAELGFVAATVPGTVVLTDDRFQWHQDSARFTHQDLQKIVHSELLKETIDNKQVFLLGCLDGATHAMLLVAQHPEKYAGVVAVEPLGGLTNALEKCTLSKTAKSRCMLVRGTSQPTAKHFEIFEKAYSEAGWKFETLSHRRSSLFPPTWLLAREKVKNFLLE